MADNEVRIRVVADSREAVSSFSGLKDSISSATSPIDGMISKFGSLKTAMTAAFAGLAAMEGAKKLGELVLSAAEDEASVRRLQLAIENTGASYEKYAKQIDEAVKSAQNLAFADDQARSSLSLLAAQTGNAEEAQKRFKVAMDLSRGANIDLETASRLLGKISEENIQVLKRYGITIRDGATETEALAEVQRRFANQADEYANTAAGSWERLKIQIGELGESIGYLLLPVFKLLTVAAEGAVNAVNDLVIGPLQKLLDIGGKIKGIFTDPESFLGLKPRQADEAGDAIGRVAGQTEDARRAAIAMSDANAKAAQSLMELGSEALAAKYALYIYQADVNGATDAAEGLIESAAAFVKEALAKERTVKLLAQELMHMADSEWNAERGITAATSAQREYTSAQRESVAAASETIKKTDELAEALKNQIEQFNNARSALIGGLSSAASAEQMRTAAGEGLSLYRDASGNQQFYRTGQEPAGYSLLFNPSTAFGGAQAAEGAPGTTVAPITVNINGIITDPVATGQAVADALNAAATQSGPVLSSGVVR